MTKTSLFWIAALSLALASCRSKPVESPEPAKAAEAKEAAGKQEAGEHEEEASDLNQPVAELLAKVCEHQMKMFECDECRYEVGVVKAQQRLLDEGLIATTHAVRERVALPLVLTGEVRFDERRVTHVTVPSQGVVRKVSVTLGDKVLAGQPLLEVESVEIGEAEGSYLEAKAALRLAERNFERQTELRKESISSEKDFLQVKQEHESALIRVDAALGKLRRLGGSPLEGAGLAQGSSHGRLFLRAPVAGTVLRMHAVPGEVVKSDEPLVTLGDNSTVWVWADLYERDIASVMSLQADHRLTAVISVKAYPKEEFPGTVDFVSPAMEEASRTVKVRVEVPNAQRRLLAGMFATVKVFLPSTEETLTLPKDAVLEDEGRSFVFVHHHGDFYVRRPVTRGRAWAGRVEVAGLRGDETVVAQGAFLMKSDVLRSKMGAGCAD